MKKLLLILSFFFLFLSLFIFRHYLSIFYFQNDLNKIAINIETKENIGNIFVCFDKNCDEMNYENNIYSYALNQQNPLFYDNISNINILVNNKNNIDKINNISFFNGNKFNYYDIKSLSKTDTSFLDKENYSVEIPFASNSKNIIQKASIYFESLFYNWYFYVLSYILIVFCIIKYDIKINFNNKLILAFIIFIGAFLRLSHIDFIPLWNDELYTYTVISDCGSGFNLKNIFLDAGNPPLFFILSNIWLKFFNNSVFLIRLLPCLIGIFGIYFIYFVVGQILNKKTALISSFLLAINIFAITESNEIRSYILSMSLILFGGLTFYRLYQNQTNKNLIFYLISSILLVNVHFYCFLYCVFNFISGLILFKQTRLKFFLLNILSFSVFGIYFLINYKKSLSSDFNTWLSKPTIDVLYNHIVFYFGNFIFFVLFIAFLIFMMKKLSKTEKSVIYYILSSITFVFVSSYIISWIIKPILFERYFCIFLPYFIIITSILLSYEYKTKIKPLILVLIFLFSTNAPKYENFNLFSNIYYMVKYSTIDFLNYKGDCDIYFIIPDNIKYIDYFKSDFLNINKENIIVSNNGIKENIDIVNDYVKKSKKRNVVVYLPEICTNQIVKKKYNAKKIHTSILPIYKIIVLK